MVLPSGAPQESEPEGGSIQESTPWSGVSFGDAQRPISDINFGHYLQAMSGKGRVYQYGLLDTNHASYNGHLLPTNPAGTTLRMASGAAHVFYHIYLNDANIDFTLSNAGYYRLVLSRENQGLPDNPQTVRAKLKGPRTQGWPSVSYSAPFELPIARAHSTGAAIDQLIDDRRFFRNLSLPFRQGNSGQPTKYDGTGTDYLPTIGVNIQVGAVEADGFSGFYDFPYPIYYGTLSGDTPIVFLQAVSNFAATPPVATELTMSGSVETQGSYNTLSSLTGIQSVQFMAIGQRRA